MTRTPHCIDCGAKASHGPRCTPCNTELGHRVERERANCSVCGVSAKNVTLFAQPGQPYACAQHRDTLDQATHQAMLAHHNDQEHTDD